MHLVSSLNRFYLLLWVLRWVISNNFDKDSNCRKSINRYRRGLEACQQAKTFKSERSATTLFSSFFFRRVRATSMTQRRVENMRVHFWTFSPVSANYKYFSSTQTSSGTDLKNFLLILPNSKLVVNLFETSKSRQKTKMVKLFSFSWEEFEFSEADENFTVLNGLLGTDQKEKVPE